MNREPRKTGKQIQDFLRRRNPILVFNGDARAWVSLVLSVALRSRLRAASARQATKRLQVVI
jgi:hypothetical protein